MYQATFHFTTTNENEEVIAQNFTATFGSEADARAWLDEQTEHFSGLSGYTIARVDIEEL